MDIQATANPDRNLRTQFKAGPAGTRNLTSEKMHNETVSTIVLTPMTSRALTPFITCLLVARIEIRFVLNKKCSA